jgi:membrane-bound metal-dependent hydrolase YbcI (DUF457 family)
MAFPPAHMLVGAGVAEVVGTAVPLPRWRSWLVASVLAVLPDADIILGIALGRGAEYHGTFTHSVVAVLVIAVLAGAVAGPRWAALAGAGYASHLAVDLLDDRGRTNVLLGWPFTDERPFAIARIFPTVPFEQGEGPVAAALSLLRPDVLERLLLQTAVGAGFLLVLLFLSWLIRRIQTR